MKYIKMLKAPFRISVVMVILCGFIYPVAVTGLAQLIFPHQANGSLIVINGKEVGSEIVGQNFTDSRFMKCRPSAVGYNVYTDAEKVNGEYQGVASGSANYAASNAKLAERVKRDIDSFLNANPSILKEEIPADLMTASGSGLDPHISLASAAIQISAIARKTGLPEEAIAEIVKSNASGKFWGVFGENKVNVLNVNLEIAKRIGIISVH